MLNRISAKFHAWAKGWRGFILFLADALMMGYIMPVAAAIMALAANNSVMPLDLMFFYTPQQAFDMIEKYGPEGRVIYAKIELSADIIYPIVYTLFFALLISWLFQRGFRPGSPIQTWNVMPMGAWLFDLLENIGTVSMVAAYPSQPAILAWITMFIGLIKWGFAFISLGLILVGAVMAARNGFRKQE